MVYSLSLSRCLLKNSDKAEVCSSWNSKVVDMIELLKVQFGQFHVLPFYFNILGLDLAFGLLRHRETQRLSVHPLLTIPTVEFPTSVLPFLCLPLSILCKKITACWSHSSPLLHLTWSTATFTSSLSINGTFRKLSLSSRLNKF